MKLSFYFPCCIARNLDFIHRKYKRSNSGSFCFLIGCLVLFTIMVCVTMRDLLLDAGILCSAEAIMLAVNATCNYEDQNEQVFHLLNSSTNADPHPRSLCSQLCHSKQDILPRITCQSKHLSKTSVFVLSSTESCNDKTSQSQLVKEQLLVIKSITEIVPEDDLTADETSYWKSSKPDTPLPSLEDFLNMVRSMVSLSAAASEKDRGVQQLLSSARNLYASSSRRSHDQMLKQHQTFWQFVEDQEFLLTLLLQETELFPHLVDTCGQLYAVEFAQTLPENILIPFSMSRNEKLLKAIDIVKFVERLDTAWREPLHLCDVKMPHFGWTASGLVKFVDVDTVMTDSLLVDTMRNVPHCETDEDCTFFDCVARCDVGNRCIPVRTNTNLQVVCGKVFLGQGSSTVRVLGLLHDERGLLEDALELCRTNPGMTGEALLDVLRQAYSTQVQ